MKSCYIEIKQSITERVAHYHNLTDFLDENYESSIPKLGNLNFRHSFRYLAKFSVFCIAAVVLFMVNTFVFYQDLEDLLNIRPLVVLLRKTNSMELAFYTLETQCTGTNYSITALYQHAGVLGDPMANYDNVDAGYLLHLDGYKDKNLEKMMSSTLQQTIYEEILNVDPFLAFGTYLGIRYIEEESHRIVFDDLKNSYDQLQSFFYHHQSLNNVLRNTVNITNNDSQNIINHQINYLIIFNVVSCSVLILLFFAFYLPLFNYEIRVIKNLTLILKIIPNKTIVSLMSSN